VAWEGGFEMSFTGMGRTARTCPLTHRPTRGLAGSRAGLAVVAFLALGIPDARADELGDALKGRVQEVLDGKRSLAEVRIEVVAGRPNRRGLTIYGSGVGTWNQEKQFVLSPDTHRELLKKLLASGLFDMPEKPKPPRQVEMNPPVVVRSVGVRVGELERTVSQNTRVWPLAALEQLVADLFELCRPAVERGTSAVTLTDGLEKVAAGKLAPEAFSLVLNIPPAASGPNADGLLAEIEAGVLTWRVQPPGKAPPVVRRALTSEQIRGIAARIAAADFERFPPNLHRERYVDLRTAVLNRVHSVQARRFARPTPADSTDRQKALDELVAAVRALEPSEAAGEEPKGEKR